MHDGTIVQIATGRYVLQIGEPFGAVIREIPAAERTHAHPRPAPVLQRPKLMRGLVGRDGDVADALSGLDAGLPVEASGERGIGKTAVLRHLAHHARVESFADGVVYLSARHQSFIDLQQLLFEGFYEPGGFSKPTEAEIRRALQDKQALILIDDVHLAQDELEQLFDTAPRCAFVVATRARRLWGEVHSLALKGLPLEDAVSLLERVIEHSLELAERTAAESLCTAIGGSPLRIRQAAALIREQAIPAGEWDRIVTQSLIESLMASVDDKQRRALLALASVPGVSLPALHISGIAEITDVEPSLAALVRRGLIVRSQWRYRLADGVTDRLRRTEDLKPWASRVITYFSGWAERHARKDEALLQESEALLRVQQDAADARRSGEVLHLGRLLDGPLAAGARWGAWGITLERSLDASRAIGDRSAEAWALHQLGSRALCLGEPGTARALLTKAVKLREALTDDAAAAASRGNLAFVLPPVVEEPRPPAVEEPRPPAGEAARPPEPVTPVAPLVPLAPVAPVAPIALNRVLDLGSLPFRDVPPPTSSNPSSNPKTFHADAAVFVMLVFLVLGGLAFWKMNPAAVDSVVQSGLERARARIAAMRTRQKPEPGTGSPQHHEPLAVASTEETVALASDPPVTPPVTPPSTTDRASILIFTPRPGSITTGGPTSLCYAVSDALQARVEPEIGVVSPARTLTCVRVAPARTTTYELTAYGRDGYQVRQQLVIVVR